MTKSEAGVIANRTELAKTFGVSLLTVDNWVVEGCPYVRKANRATQTEWQFRTSDVYRWRLERAAAQSEAKEDIKDLKLRILSAEAAMAEIDLAEKRKKLIDINTALQMVGDDFSRCKSRLLAIPAKLAPRLLRVKELGQIKQLLEIAINEALQELNEDSVKNGFKS